MEITLDLFKANFPMIDSLILKKVHKPYIDVNK